MKKCLLSITLCEGRAYSARRLVMFKLVEWPSVPRVGDLIDWGQDEDGERPACSSEVSRVWFGADGSVGVETRDNENLGLESVGGEGGFDKFVEYARRDGFSEDLPDE